MTEYPDGVFRNNATENMPIQPLPVDDSMWKAFSTQEDADKGFGMIDAVCDNAEMVDAETVSAEGQQYMYRAEARLKTIHCRIVRATAKDDEGGLLINEYPSDIFDRDKVPLPMVDSYTAGEPHMLKVMRLTSPPQGPGRGQLYWDAA